jgi:hypothetical protein
MAQPAANIVTSQELAEALTDVRQRLGKTGVNVEFIDPVMGTDSTGDLTVRVIALMDDADLPNEDAAGERILDILDEMRRVFNERGIDIWPFVNIVRRSDQAELQGDTESD